MAVQSRRVTRASILLVALTLAACGRAGPIQVRTVAPEKAPPDLVTWVQVRPEAEGRTESGRVIAVFHQTHEATHLFLSVGACPTSHHRLAVTGARGNGLPVLSVVADLSKPWWRRADGKVSYPQTFTWIQWRWGPVPMGFSLTVLGQAGLAMELRPPETGQPDSIRVYRSKTPFTCR